MPKHPVAKYRTIATQNAPQLNVNGANKAKTCIINTPLKVPIAKESHFPCTNTFFGFFTTTSERQILWEYDSDSDSGVAMNNVISFLYCEETRNGYYYD